MCTRQAHQKRLKDGQGSERCRKKHACCVLELEKGRDFFGMTPRGEIAIPIMAIIKHMSIMSSSSPPSIGKLRSLGERVCPLSRTAAFSLLR
jgi:hypothetical protein